MEATTRPAPLESASRPAPLEATTKGDHAQLAKAALRRLAAARLEPTPENYLRAWQQESGEPPEAPAEASSDGPAIAALIERIVRGIERGSRGWTAARKKESLQRVLDGSRSDARRLQQRLTQLVGSWDDPAAVTADAPSTAAAAAAEAGVPGTLAGTGPGAPSPAIGLAETASAGSDAGARTASAGAPAGPVAAAAIAGRGADPVPEAPVASRPWGRAVGALGSTVEAALPPASQTAGEAATGAVEAFAGIAALVRDIVSEGATEGAVAALERRCGEAVPLLQHRHRLQAQLAGLCAELAASLTDLAEDESWARGQCEAMRAKLDEGLSARGIRAVSELLRDTRERQSALKGERERARESLKGLIARMLAELDELGSRTGQFHDSVGRYAGIIERADTLESLTGVVRELVEESRSVQTLVQQTQARLAEEHGRTLGLSKRVVELESEMERLSSEVATDQLTQVANRRGLEQAFEAEQRRAGEQGAPLAVGLLDIDNFKRLNDELGHGAGDEALRALASVVARTLRPGDHVARYGGEEFVVLLPDTPVADGQQILTRLQRSLTGGLFLHESRQVFVTFSAGVTAWRSPERLESALERADQALYEAKRTGKNRTCVG